MLVSLPHLSEPLSLDPVELTLQFRRQNPLKKQVATSTLLHSGPLQYGPLGTE